MVEVVELLRYSETIKGVIDTVDTLVASTEEIYSSIYAQLPVIESEIEFALNEMGILLEFFVSTQQQEAKQTASYANDAIPIAVVLRDVLNKLADKTKGMAAHDEMEKAVQMFTRTTDHSFGIQKMIKMIDAIRARIKDIELVSLNALVFSAHLGEEGRAFGVISDNIGKLSGHISSRYDEIIGSVQGLEDWAETFTTNSQNMLEYHHKLTNSQLTELRRIVDAVFASMDQVSVLLQDLITNLEGAVRPIQDLMVSIQSQDIIRQNLENLCKCLHRALDALQDSASNEGSDVEKTLRTLTFTEYVCNLNSKLIDNIEDTLLGSVGDLQMLIDQIDTNLADLAEDGYLVTQFLANGQDSQGIQEIFGNVQAFMGEFIAELSSLHSDMENMSADNSSCHNYMQEIERKMIEIHGKAEFMQKLKLMTAIELGRLRLENNFFEREIAVTADQVLKDVSANEQLIAGIRNQMARDMDRFEKMLAINVKNTDEMSFLVKTSKEQVHLIEQMILQGVEGLGVAGANLFEEIQRATTHLRRSGDLRGLLHSIKDQICDLGRNVAAHKAAILEQENLVSWDEIGRDLNAVLESLTTRVERISANEILALEEDVGNEEGELTLF